jgi:hypothetical protein
MRILSQNTPINNFSTVRPIFTKSIPIDPAQQLFKYGNIKNVPNFILGEQLGNFHKTTPIITFQPNRPILTNNIPINSAEQAEDYKT